MTKLILAALALATAHYAQTVEPLTGPSYVGDRAKINRNFNKAVTKDGSGNVVVPGTLSVGAVLPAVLGGRTWYFGTGLNGGVCSGATDNTTTFQALLTTVAAAGGGTIHVVGKCRINGQLTLPNSGDATDPSQAPIRITGDGTSANGGNYQTSTIPDSASALDLRYNATYGKILTLGRGQLEIDHIALIDGGSDCAAFVYTTNTTLKIHHALFSGTAAGVSACNDAIILGGTEEATGLAATKGFQGYGTVIDSNIFDKISRLAFFRQYANSVQFTNNHVFLTCGGDETHPALDFAGTMMEGNYIAGNLIETKYYVYGVICGNGCTSNTFVGNSFWDSEDNYTVASYLLTGTGYGNIIVTGYADSAVGWTEIIEADANYNAIIRPLNGKMRLSALQVGAPYAMPLNANAIAEIHALNEKGVYLRGDSSGAGGAFWFDQGSAGSVWGISGAATILGTVGNNPLILSAKAGTNPITIPIDGGVKLPDSSVLPTCDASRRHTILSQSGGTGTGDYLVVCQKQAAGDTYAWRTLSHP